MLVGKVLNLKVLIFRTKFAFAIGAFPITERKKQIF